MFLDLHDSYVGFTSPSVFFEEKRESDFYSMVLQCLICYCLFSNKAYNLCYTVLRFKNDTLYTSMRFQNLIDFKIANMFDQIMT